MKNRIAAFLASGVLAVGVLAGTAGTASAEYNSYGPYGPLPSGPACNTWVNVNGHWGVWDCEPVGGKYHGWYAIPNISSFYGPYATGPDCVHKVPTSLLGTWDCEYVGGVYPGWYIFTP